MHAFILFNAISISIGVVGISPFYREDKGLNRLTIKSLRHDRAQCSKPMYTYPSWFQSIVLRLTVHPI